MVILVTNLDAATARAVGYVRSVRPRGVTALTFDKSHAPTLRRLAPDIPLVVAEVRGSLAASVKDQLRQKRRELPSQDFLTVVVPELLRRRGVLER